MPGSGSVEAISRKKAIVNAIVRSAMSGHSSNRNRRQVNISKLYSRGHQTSCQLSLSLDDIGRQVGQRLAGA